MNFKEIDEARKILGLGESATLKEIRDAYRQLVLKYHPDRSGATDKKKCSEIFQKVTDAYNTIITYCMSYRYSFKKQDVEGIIDKDIDEEYLKNFYDGWIVNFKKENYK